MYVCYAPEIEVGIMCYVFPFEEDTIQLPPDLLLNLVPSIVFISEESF